MTQMECRPGLFFSTVPTVGHSASALSFIQHHLCISALKVNSYIKTAGEIQKSNFCGQEFCC